MRSERHEAPRHSGTSDSSRPVSDRQDFGHKPPTTYGAVSPHALFARSKSIRLYVDEQTTCSFPFDRCCFRAGPARWVEGCLRFTRPGEDADASFLDWSSEIWRTSDPSRIASMTPKLLRARLLLGYGSGKCVAHVSHTCWEPKTLHFSDPKNTLRQSWK